MAPENDEELAREVASTLHVDIVPGTEIMAQDGMFFSLFASIVSVFPHLP